MILGTGFLGLLLPLSLIIPLHASGTTTGAEVMERVFDRYDGEDSEAVYAMTLEAEGGDRRIRDMIMYRKDVGDLEKRLIRFTSPADIAGTGFLNWDNIGREDDQFLYLPALKRVRRIVSSQKHRRFVNTDFTNEDMERREVARDDHDLLGTEEYNGLRCYVVKSTPKEKGNSQYGYVKSWLAEDLDIAVKMEFFDKKLNHRKTFEVMSLKKIDTIWTVVKSSMVDHDRKHRTTLELKSIGYNVGIPDSYFTKHFLQSY
jgi:hypothetical protein